MASGWSVVLRVTRETANFHAAADASWLELLRPDVGRDAYLRQLQRAYGFEAPLESACAYTAALHDHLDLRELTKSGLLAQDLLALDMTPGQVATLAQATKIIAFDSVPEALGWMYVIERGTLLREAVRRHLIARLPELTDACAYLGAPDAARGVHWRTFRSAVEEVGRDDEAAHQIVAAAHRAFDAWVSWMGMPGPATPHVPDHHDRPRK